MFIRLVQFTRTFVALTAFGLLLAIVNMPAHAHQAVNPNILKLVAKAPAGSLTCRDSNGPIMSPECIQKGRQLFEKETFGGNGRTCATCHPANNNFTIDVPYIKKLPSTDKLFVNEQIAALAELETPLLRIYGLICENLDGFGALGRDDEVYTQKRNCVMRSVIATEGLKATTAPDGGGFDPKPTPGATNVVPARPTFPLRGALGWGGDGSPGDGSLRNFAIGAVMQHFPRSLARTPGVDFNLPSEDQLDAMEVFQLSLGRQEDMNLNPDPYGQALTFNCEAYKDETNKDACKTSPVFELKSMADLKAWRRDSFTGILIDFTDPIVTNGQVLFFGGIPSQNGIRSCSGCHIQAGGGSGSGTLTKNQPTSNGFAVGNRQRATGASFAPNAPICLTEAQGIIYNADGGFGAGAAGFPYTKASNFNLPEECGDPLTFTNKFDPVGGCFKHFGTIKDDYFGTIDDALPTKPPLSNPTITDTAADADVGVRNTKARSLICVNSTGMTDDVFITGTGFFSTPSVIESASTIPLFHNNIAATVEDAVRFYASDAFNESASGNRNKLLVDNELPAGKGDIVTDVGAFLRAINSLNNIKISARYIDVAIAAAGTNNNEKVRNAKLAFKRASDALGVLIMGGPATQNYLGGPTNLFKDAPAVTSSLISAKNRLTSFGTSDAAYGKLTSNDLSAARVKIVAACQAMLKSEAATAYCP